MRPQILYGVASGDLCVRGKAVVRSRSDRRDRMIVEYATARIFPKCPENYRACYLGNYRFYGQS